MLLKLKLDGALRLSDIKLSDKVELLALKAEEAEDLMICQLKVPKEIVEEEPEVEGEEGAEGEGAEGEEA